MKYTVEKAIAAFLKLRELNSSKRVVGGQVVDVPFQFSGGACYRIAENINALRRVVTNSNEAKAEAAKTWEALPEKKRDKGALDRKLTEIMAEEVEVVINPVSVASLNLDSNPIEPGLIADLIVAGLIERSKKP